jgi:hypothetical protein
MKQTEIIKQFELDCKKLVGQVVRGVYYEYDAPGFVNTRALKQQKFEYVPLSKLSFEMQSGLYFTFNDSIKFLENYGYYTLDVKEEFVLEEMLRNNNQSEYILWKPYLNQKIAKVEIVWASLYNDYYEGNPADTYPKNVAITFENTRTLIILACELDTVEGGVVRYKFLCPDEALIIFFSQESYSEYFVDE